MPQRKCCVASCSSTSSEGAILHAFPNPASEKNREKFDEWVKNVGLAGEDETHIYKNRRVCHLHFEKIYHYPKNRLCKFAVPRLHLTSASTDAENVTPASNVKQYQHTPANVDQSTSGISGNRSLPVAVDELPTSTNKNDTKDTSKSTSGFSGNRSLPVAVDELPTSTNKNDTKDTSKSTSGIAGNRSLPVAVDELPTSTNKNDTKDTSKNTSGVSRDRHVPMVLDELPTSTNKKDTRANISKSLQFKKLTATEIELYKAVTKTQAELRRCKKSKAGLKEKLKATKKFTHSEAYNIVTRDLSPAAQTFFAMQTRQACKRPKGRRFTLDEKILALSLYKPSPKAYRLLSQICVLPKKSTLDKLMARLCLLPGPNELVFEHLKKRVEKMPNSHKFCTLLFDEMAIAANISYDKKNDYIKGFCDDGKKRTGQFADHVLVFMIRGIFKKFKQPIAYTFCAGTTKTESLKDQLKVILKKLLATGLKVVATTCDQGATNIAAINQLINETKAEYLRNGKDFKGGFFEIDEEKIFPIFDPPHLMQGIRNNLITKNLEWNGMDGKKRTAKWEHLVALYKKSPGYNGVRLVPKLTARHVIPNLIPKMKVKYSTQVFSRTVSVALGFIAGTGRIPRESTETADLLMFFDKVFDSVNGSYNKPIKGKIYRSAVTPKSPHHKLWYKSLQILKTMKFISGRTSVVPTITSWIKTIQSFQHITKKMHNLGLKSLLLRNFNQDPLENFFGSIRAHGQGNIMPSATAFEKSYNALLVNNMCSPKTVGGNCEGDDNYCLQNLKFLLNSKIERPIMNKNIEIDANHLMIPLSNIDALLKSKSPKDVEKCAAAAYCSGWVINLVNKNISSGCNDCKHDLEGGSEEDYSKFITLKKYTNKSSLHYPNKRILEYFINVEEITLAILRSNCTVSQICEYIKLIVTSLTDLNFLKCAKHKKRVGEFLLQKCIQFFIMDWCKEVNYILIGKNTVFDEGDPIKEMAFKYYVTHKTKKRVRESGKLINV